jgi:TPR repeat protein
MKLRGFAVAAVAAAVSLSAPAYADPDTDFDNQLQKFGIYGAHDYNPYLGKIVCHRLGVGVDRDAAASAHFLSINLARGTTQVQAYQFLGSAIAQYCPDLQGKLQNIPAR